MEAGKRDWMDKDNIKAIPSYICTIHELEAPDLPEDAGYTAATLLEELRG